MREVSLLPSSLRLDLLLSAAGFSSGSSSDWPSVVSQAILLACVGQAFTNTVSSDTRTAARHQTHSVHMHKDAFHAHGARTHICCTYRCFGDL